MAIEDLTPQEKIEAERLMNKIEAPSEGRSYLPEQPGGRKFGEAPKPNPSTVQRILPPEQWVAKQIDTLRQVGEANYITGIRNPRKDPIKAGIAAQDKYEQKMKDPEVLKRRKTKLERTNMDEWTAMAEKRGAQNLVSGVTDRQYKVERFVGKYHSLLKSHLDRIDGMADVTDSDREKKVIENLRGLRALKGKA